MKSHEHLSKISERGGDEYRQHVEDKLSAIEARDRGNKKHEALGDIEQPEAAELLDFIARCNMDAHAELGNLASNDEVWQRAMAVASGEITRASEDEANSALTKEMMKGLFAMGLLSSQLDTMAAVYAKENCPQVIRDFIENGSSYVLELAGEAINESKDSGLVGLVQARESNTVTGIPIGSQVTQVLYERKKARAQEHKQAIIANAERNSPEQNDADLAALIERQEDRTRRVHAEHDNPGSAIIDIDNDTEAVQGKLILQTGNYSNEVANSYIRMLREKSDYESSLASNPYTASRRKREKVRGRDALMQELSIIPVDRLQSMYFSAKDKEGGALRYMVRQGIEDYNGTGAHGHNKLIEKIYSTKGYHLANDERARRDPLLKKKLETPLGYLEFAVPVEQPTDKAEYAEFTQALRDNSEILFRKLGLPESVTDGLRRSINEKTMMKGQDGFTARGEDRCVDSRQLRRELKTILDAVETIGVDNVTKLAEICGIINIQNDSREQLERMVQFVDGDQELIDHLGRGDVTAVLIDATGDHNGAMKDASKDFDKPSGRSLFFEVN
ncbi:hypothetical protein HY312_03545 [Candidatus Saccharibacteria bacterium]|nr:hypothetical protein [Candidatus Saccharibacteria bacterium]